MMTPIIENINKLEIKIILTKMQTTKRQPRNRRIRSNSSHSRVSCVTANAVVN